MSSKDVFWGIGDLFQWMFQGLQADAIGNIFNYSMICLGFFGLFYWLIKQKKFNDAADKDSGRLK